MTPKNAAPRPSVSVKKTPTEASATRRAAWERLWNRLLADPDRDENDAEAAA